jgi:maltooligosyltrehalose trehalohydrolase
MTFFRLWAPRAERVDVVVAGQRFDLAAAPGIERGWWQRYVRDAGPGVEYGFSLDGGEPLPDPRSPWQPEGIAGMSRVVDHSAFRWTDGPWRGGVPLAGAVLYEIHVGTFTEDGTFDGVIDRLDALTALGVTAVELMPVAEFSGDRGWGYDGVDLYAPHHAYGGPDGLKRLVDACHSRGLSVVLDVVYNHLGPVGNYLAEYGPYFTDRYSTPWGSALNLDGPDCDPVRAFLIDNAVMWLSDYHVDALRLDAVHAIVDNSAVHFLEELAQRVDVLQAHLGRRLTLIAESDRNDPRPVRTVQAGGYGLDGVWLEDFHHALHAVLADERTGYYEDFGSLADLATALTRAHVYDGRYSVFRRRRHGAPAAGLAGTSFVGYLQNHDQIGNRAYGERSTHLMSPGRRRVGLAMVLLAPFVPLLFQGEEWDASTPFLYFTDHADPDLGRAVADGRRREFPSIAAEDIPDPQDPATMARCVLRWEERVEPEHARMLQWASELIALRRQFPSLTDGRLDRVEVAVDEAAGWLLLRRPPITAVVNIGEGPIVCSVPDGAALCAVSEPTISLDDDGTTTVPPDAVVVWWELVGGPGVDVSVVVPAG